MGDTARRTAGGEWYTSFYIVQQYDSLQEVARLITGQARWADPQNHEFWSKLEKLTKAGFVNDDANSLESLPGRSSCSSTARRP